VELAGKTSEIICPAQFALDVIALEQDTHPRDPSSMALVGASRGTPLSRRSFRGQRFLVLANEGLLFSCGRLCTAFAVVWFRLCYL